MANQSANQNVTNRWVIATAGVVMQVALGAVYAWSVFRRPLSDHYGTGVAEVNTAFSIAILALGFAAFAGGVWMNKSGPRVVALTAGVLYGAGIFLASFAAPSVWILYLSYGLMAGIGIGLGYIVPVATLIKWFPDKRGFITGIAVAGFGAGALLTAPIAKQLVNSSSVGLFPTFAILGILYLIMVVGAGFFMKNPPEGWTPEGWEPEEEDTGEGESTTVDLELGEALKSWQWYALWALLFLNVTAGIAIISEADPIAQEVSGVAPFLAAWLVSIISIGNAVGRFLWAWLSDAIGRKWVFLSMFLLQAALFFLIPLIGWSFFLLAVFAFIIVSCYGGGFGTMPAFSADYFGSKNVGMIYGLMLTAWGFGGVLGPTLISYMYDATGSYAGAFRIIAGIMLVSAIIPFIVRPPKREASASAGAEARA